MLPQKQIESALQGAVRAVLPDADVASVLVRPCDPKFGDYQSNALMSLAKQLKMNPRQLATDVVAKLDVSAICEKVEIAGAGFLNFRLKNSALVDSLQSAARGEHLFFSKAAAPKTPIASRRLLFPLPLAPTNTFTEPSSTSVFSRDLNDWTENFVIIGEKLYQEARELYIKAKRITLKTEF